MAEEWYSDHPRRKVGKWKLIPNWWVPHRSIDYDHYLVDGKPLDFTGEKEIISELKSTANQKIKEVYGEEIFEEYVRWDMGSSRYANSNHGRNSFPSGGSMFQPAP